MSTDTTTTVEHTVADSSPTGIARCEALDGQSEPYTVHGVAVGANEVTHGANGAKFWPAEELRKSAQSLVGVPLTKNHDDRSVESVVGQIIDAGFEPGVGIVYEAEVDDEDLATKIARGRLEVSVHALHRDGGRTGEGELIVEDVRFLDLSLVPRGGSPANYVEAGDSPSEVLASLSTDDVAGFFSTGSTETDESMTDDTDEIEDEAELESDEAESDETESECEAEEGEAETEAELEAEEAEGGAEEAELETVELREDLESLRAENQELRNELESVRLEYAERLSDGGPFSAAQLAEKFSFDELKENFEEAEASLVTDEETSEATTSTPSPMARDGESEELSTRTDSASADEAAELEAKIEKYDKMGWSAAKADAEARLESIQS